MWPERLKVLMGSWLVDLLLGVLLVGSLLRLVQILPSRVTEWDLAQYYPSSRLLLVV